MAVLRAAVLRAAALRAAGLLPAALSAAACTALDFAADAAFTASALAVLFSTAMLRAAAVFAAFDFTAVVRAPAGRLAAGGRGAVEPAAASAFVACGVGSAVAKSADAAFPPADVVAAFFAAAVLGAAFRTGAAPRDSAAAASVAEGFAVAAVAFDAPDLVVFAAVAFAAVDVAAVVFADADFAGVFGVPSSFSVRARGARGAAVFLAGAEPWWSAAGSTVAGGSPSEGP